MVVCGLGFIGNVSSLFVLLRHQKDVAGSRLLLALGVADLGVILSITWRTVAYVTSGYSQQTATAEWVCLYWYYCSIYFTIFLSLDRCLSSAYPMLLLKVNYTGIQKRLLVSAFPVMFLITLPHLLGFTVTYHHGSHSIEAPIIKKSQKYAFCDFLSHNESSDNEVLWTVAQCGNTNGSQNLSTSEVLSLRHIPQLLNTWCNSTTETKSSIYIRIPAAKFRPNLVSRLRFGVRYSDGTKEIAGVFLTICNSTRSSMRHDPDFVKAVYLGVDLSFRYVIPCLALIVINIRLLVAVYKAQKRHKRIIGDTTPVSLLDLPVLKSVGAIVLVFFCMSHRRFGHVHY